MASSAETQCAAVFHAELATPGSHGVIETRILASLFEANPKAARSATEESNGRASGWIQVIAAFLK